MKWEQAESRSEQEVEGLFKIGEIDAGPGARIKALHPTGDEVMAAVAGKSVRVRRIGKTGGAENEDAGARSTENQVGEIRAVQSDEETGALAVSHSERISVWIAGCKPGISEESLDRSRVSEATAGVLPAEIEAACGWRATIAHRALLPIADGLRRRIAGQAGKPTGDQVLAPQVYLWLPVEDAFSRDAEAIDKEVDVVTDRTGKIDPVEVFRAIPCRENQRQSGQAI